PRGRPARRLCRCRPAPARPHGGGRIADRRARQHGGAGRCRPVADGVPARRRAGTRADLPALARPHAVTARPMTSYATSSAAEIAAAVAAGTVSARTVVDQTLARIDAVDPRVGAFTDRVDARARAAADARGPGSGPLAGVP